VPFLAVRPQPRCGARTAGASESQSGQGLVEYALILVIVSIVAIFLIVSMGSRLTGMFSNVVTALGTH